MTELATKRNTIPQLVAKQSEVEKGQSFAEGLRQRIIPKGLQFLRRCGSSWGYMFQ